MKKDYYSLRIPKNRIIQFSDCVQNGKPVMCNDVYLTSFYAYLDKDKIKPIYIYNESGVDGRIQITRFNPIDFDIYRFINVAKFNPMFMLSVLKKKSDMYLYGNFDVYQKLIDHNKNTGMCLYYYIDIGKISDIIGKRLSVDDIMNFYVKDGYVRLEIKNVKHPFSKCNMDNDNGWMYVNLQ